ncbi:MAG: hypothetical protein DCF25_03185 [Leptolyngbya foveolarum]|uniref:Protein kinase domain-containing protein n=1 Tax=Leptolyngbya foveolarum TaxID=47253 RepID=A0A2W4ULN2_9CYAN|nr:MAG: hypothetical protein DCF25_03185 [Leptolyngbya foveolarum]
MSFSDYRLLGLVGQGQFAQVYGAVHKRTGQLVAIKQTCHAPEQASQEPFVLNELCHPNIVCCQAIAQTQTGYQFVLDYCEAGTLRSQIDLTSQSNVLAQPLLCRIAVDILKGLSYIHSQQVIHGDLKPENILLTYQSQLADDKISRLTARIGDFGSARFVEMPSQARKEIGSPTYAAPERFYGQSSYASDLYSVGVILYELLLGDRPFSGSPDHLRQAHQTQAVPFPRSLSTPVQQLLERSLHKHPNQRFSSANEMLSAFQTLPDADVMADSKGGAIAAIKRDLPVQSTHVDHLKPAIEPLSTNTNEKPLSKVHQLLAVPQGCFVVTNSTIYRLNVQGALDSVIQLNQPSWIVISPDESWLVVFPKVSQQPAQSKGQLITLRDFVELKPENRRSVDLEEKLLRSVQASVVQTLAVDRRYIVRVLTSLSANKSCLECFTRKGKLIGDLPLNISLSHAALSLDSYQIVALSAPNASEAVKLLLISLRPFQVRSVVLSTTDLRSNPRGVGVFSWGYAVIDDGGCLFLDRLAQPVGRLNLMGVRAIAPLPDTRALVVIATPKAAQLKNNSLKDTFSNESALFVIDLKSLDLDLVF